MNRLKKSFTLIAFLLGAFIAVTQSSFRTAKTTSVPWGKYTGASDGTLVQNHWYQYDSPPAGYNVSCDESSNVCTRDFSYDPNTDNGANPDGIDIDNGNFNLTAQ